MRNVYKYFRSFSLFSVFFFIISVSIHAQNDSVKRSGIVSQKDLTNRGRLKQIINNSVLAVGAMYQFVTIEQSSVQCVTPNLKLELPFGKTFGIFFEKSISNSLNYDGKINYITNSGFDGQFDYTYKFQTNAFKIGLTLTNLKIANNLLKARIGYSNNRLSFRSISISEVKNQISNSFVKINQIGDVSQRDLMFSLSKYFWIAHQEFDVSVFGLLPITTKLRKPTLTEEEGFTLLYRTPQIKSFCQFQINYHLIASNRISPKKYKLL